MILQVNNTDETGHLILSKKWRLPDEETPADEWTDSPAGIEKQDSGILPQKGKKNNGR